MLSRPLKPQKDAAIVLEHEYFPLKFESFHFFPTPYFKSQPRLDRLFQIEPRINKNPKLEYTFPDSLLYLHSETYSPSKGYDDKDVKISEDENRHLLRFPTIMHYHAKFARSFYSFIRDTAIPFAVKHGSAYIKPADSGAGQDIVKLFTRRGLLFMQTTNDALEEMARNSFWLAEGKKGGRLPSEDKLKIANKIFTAEAEQRPAIFLGKADKIGLPVMAKLSQAMFSTLRFHDHLILQKGIRQLLFNNRPLEFRFFVQRRGDIYSVTHHYAKIGGTNFVANIGHGGTIKESPEALAHALRKRFPGNTDMAYSRMTWHFLLEAEKLAKEILNRTPVADKKLEVSKIRIDSEGLKHLVEGGFKKSAEVYSVSAPPILSTVDIVPRLSESGITPVAIEHHAVGDFGIIEDIENGTIPKASAENMLAIHKQNIEWIVDEARHQIARSRNAEIFLKMVKRLARENKA